MSDFQNNNLNPDHQPSLVTHTTLRGDFFNANTQQLLIVTYRVSGVTSHRDSHVEPRSKSYEITSWNRTHGLGD